MKIYKRKTDASPNTVVVGSADFAMKEYDIIQRKIDSYGGTSLVHKRIFLAILVPAMVVIERDEWFIFAFVFLATLYMAWMEMKSAYYCSLLKARACDLEKQISVGRYFSGPQIATILRENGCFSMSKVWGGKLLWCHEVMVYWGVLLVIAGYKLYCFGWGRKYSIGVLIASWGI